MARSIAVAAAMAAVLAFFPCRSAPARSLPADFASSPARPLAAAGQRLLAIAPEEALLAVHEIDSDTGVPSLAGEIRVGLEPVSVRVRPGRPDEAWVVNALSDDVSVVDLSLGIAVATIPVGDEPADVAFTHDGSRAFVTLAGEDAVAILDAADRRVLSRVAVPGAAPRRVEVARGGRFAIVASFASGNRTTILLAGQDDSGGPRAGLIGPDDHPRSPGRLPDADLVAVDVRTGRLARRTVRGVGTILLGFAQHPARGRLFVANTEARNRGASLAEIRGRAVENRVTVVDRTRTGATVRPVSLDAGDAASSLAQPTDVALDPASGRVFVAAFGSNRVGVLDEDGRTLAVWPVSSGGRGLGPRGVVHRTESGTLYTLNRLDSTISAIDAASGEVLAVVAATAFDPVPTSVREGRRLFHDATATSASGRVSCASCHVDAGSDHLAWDLGDPSLPDEAGPGGIVFEGKKGPFATPPLRGLSGTDPFHWRGDRASIEDFAEAFVTLLGRDAPPSPDEAAALAAYLSSIRAAPNPRLAIDRVLGARAARGFAAFRAPGRFYQGRSCAACHALPLGTDRVIVRRDSLAIPGVNDLNPAALARIGGKLGRAPKTGYGLGHDGRHATLDALLASIVTLAGPIPPEDRRDLAAFLEEFDTGTAPSVGRGFSIDRLSARSGIAAAAAAALAAEARLAHADVIVSGIVEGERRNLLFDPRRDALLGESGGVGEMTIESLIALAARGRALATMRAVPPGEGRRLSIDRDGDLLSDGDEPAYGCDPLDPDTDGDGWEDGIETAEGTDPADAGSRPSDPRRPVIDSLELARSRPYSRLRLVVHGRTVMEGAVAEIALDGDRALGIGLQSPPLTWTVDAGIVRVGEDPARVRVPLVPVGPGAWATLADFDANLSRVRFDVVVENPTGARSAVARGR